MIKENKKDEVEKCRFCGMVIESLDRHAHSVSPDKDASTTGFMLVTCILNRYYTTTPQR